MRWLGHVARIREVINTYKALVVYSEMKRPLGRPRCRSQDNIKIVLRMRIVVVWSGFNEIKGTFASS
jgi:hypothetical protein